MAVITRYIVERDGEEKMTFANKKDADAYDKELDIAAAFQTFLEKSEIEIGDEQLEELSLYVAKYRDDAQAVLKGSQPKKKDESAGKEKESKDADKKAKEKSKKAEDNAAELELVADEAAA